MPTVKKEDVPVIILYWRHQFYPGVPVKAIRDFLEERLLYVPRDQGTVDAWSKAAASWRRRFTESTFKEMLREYHSH